MRQNKKIRNHQNELHRFQVRLMVLKGLLLLGFSILAGRLYFLQINKHEHFQTLAENNRISIVSTAPNRGLITDRHGMTLAHNFFAYTLEITPSKIDNLTKTIQDVSKLIEVSKSDLERFNKLKNQKHTFETIPLRTHLNEVEAAKFAANRFRFPGVEIKSRLFRHYPNKTLGAHIIGYIGRIDDKDIARLKKNNALANYKGSDHVGKSGIEQSYEKELHGTTGSRQVEINADGKVVRVLSSTAPMPGNNLTLSVDIKLQALAEKAFGDKRGALVAIEPKTGEVLALVSMPSFDPNLFVDGIDTRSWRLLNELASKPLINRPLTGVYPPGSTFKPFVALAGLEAGKRRPPYKINDQGYFMLPNSVHRYRDWKINGHGLVDMKRAITVSCDTFFYGLAVELGIEQLANFVRHFGFGEKSGIDIKGENSGLLPTTEWKNRRFNQPWYASETVIVGIGQGYTLTTPMQLAHATAILANQGAVMKPKLVNTIDNTKTGETKVIAPILTEQFMLNPENLQIVKEAMIDVTLPGGTAAKMGANAEYSIAAKTGTAQVIGIKQNEQYDDKNINEHHRDHALFIAYAPAENPQIALSVIVENGGHGGSVAGPIARKVMDYYLLGKMPTEKTKVSKNLSSNNVEFNHD